MSALGDIYPDQIIPLLLEHFVNISYSETVRLKIGEALLQISKRCGEILPKYGNFINNIMNKKLYNEGNFFMNAFLNATKDSSILIRSSALSNLGELCKQMHFALQPFIREIITCFTFLLKYEKEMEVRRGTKKNICTLIKKIRCCICCYSIIKRIR